MNGDDKEEDFGTGNVTDTAIHDYFQFNSSTTRSHALSIQPVTSTINSYRYSFFVNSVFLWNHVPFNILSIVNKALFRCKLRTFCGS